MFLSSLWSSAFLCDSLIGPWLFHRYLSAKLMQFLSSLKCSHKDVVSGVQYWRACSLQCVLPLAGQLFLSQRKLFFISRQNTLVKLPVTIVGHVTEKKEKTEA